MTIGTCFLIKAYIPSDSKGTLILLKNNREGKQKAVLENLECPSNYTQSANHILHQNKTQSR